MPGTPWVVSQGRIVVEYKGKKLYFSQGGDLGVSAEDAATYAEPETGDIKKLPATETWDTIECTRPYDKDADDFFYWCQINKPVNRYVSAAEELQNGRLQVLVNARVTSYKRTGLDQEATDIKRLTVTLDFDKAVGS